MLKILSVIGTRPEVIKMAPVIKELEQFGSEFESLVCVTGQHRDMLDPLLATFGINPNHDLDVMLPDQRLGTLTSLLFDRLDSLIHKIRPDWVLAEGDTTSVFVSSMVAYYNHVRFGHVEAGLRTGDRGQPFPEEVNRVVADHVADLMFAPTETNRQNLLREGLPDAKIIVTGNTVVDALQLALTVPYDWATGPLASVSRTERIVLITAHRRENLGEPMRQLLRAVASLARRFEGQGIQFVFPVHRNPMVGAAVTAELGSVDNVLLLDPLDYVSLLNLMRECALVLTDSGGIQEEAPSLGVPVLVMRERTERPEGLDTGLVSLVGTDFQRIVSIASRVLSEPSEPRRGILNPYGDGKAAQRIVEALRTGSAASS